MKNISLKPLHVDSPDTGHQFVRWNLSYNAHLYVFLGDDIEDLWTVSEKTLDHLQYIVCEQRHVQLVDKHFEPLARGKLAAVLAIASDYGGQQFVESVVDLYGYLGAPSTALLPCLGDDIEGEEE